MEFDAATVKLQQELQKLTENEEKPDIARSVQVLSSIFLEHPVKHAALTYYMVLSSNHGLLDRLLDDTVAGFLLLNCVPLDLDWTINILRKLDLQLYLYQIIQYGPVGVTVKILEVLNLEPPSDFLIPVAAAISSKMTRLLHDESKGNAAVIETHLFSCLDHLKVFLCEGFSKNDYYQKCGERIDSFLNHLLSFMSACFNKNCINLKLEEFYALVEEYGNETTQTPKIRSPEDILTIWLQILENTLKNVSCEVWMCWEELEDTPNLQTKIGNQIYEMDRLLLQHKIPLPGHLAECFKQMKIKPITEQDMIAGATLSLLIKKVDENGPTTHKWYRALCERDETWKNPKITATLLSKLQLAQNPREIILKSMELLLSEKDSELSEPFFIALESSDCATQIEILERFCSVGNIVDFYSTESKAGITTICNKLSTDSDLNELRELVKHVIKCPTFVLQNVFQLAATSKENHQLCRKMLIFFSPGFKITTFFDDETDEKMIGIEIFNHVFQKMLNVSHSDKEWHNLCDFLKEDFEKPPSFLSDCLIKTLEDTLSRRDWNKSKYAAVMVRSIVFEGNGECKIELLAAVLAQALLICSWDAQTFDAHKVDVYQVCCDIVRELNLLEVNSTWLSKLLSQLPSHIQTHFCDLWFGIDGIYAKPSKPFLCLLIAARTKSIEVQSAMRKQFLNARCTSLQHRIFTALFKILPILHCSEWLAIFQIACGLLTGEEIKLTVFKLFAHAVTAFAMCWDEDIASCVAYCVQNLSSLFKMILDAEEWSLSDRLFMFKLVIQPLQTMSATARDSCYFLMLPVLLKCVKISGDNEDVDVLLPFLNSVDETWRDKFQEALKTPWNANGPVES